MKYHFLLLLLLAGLITAGCISENKNAVVTSTPQIVYITVTVTPTETQSTIASSIPSTSPTPSFTIPKRVDDLNEQNQCQVMVACGKAITNDGCLTFGEETGVKNDDSFCIIEAKNNPDPICQKAVWMNVYVNNCIKSNPYEASGNKGLECLHCMQGVGDLETCLKIAEKCGISRDSMKSMYCSTSSC